MVAGQGGDGSLTVISILTELLARRGYHLFTSRNVASRIKGGLAAATMRGSVARRGCLGDSFEFGNCLSSILTNFSLSSIIF